MIILGLDGFISENLLNNINNLITITLVIETILKLIS